MRLDPASFRYERDLSGRINGRSFYWRLPGDLHAKTEVLAAFSKALWFPRNFGEDWDELLDCLCDLGWVPDHKVVILHETLPRLPDVELRTYLGVLLDAVRWWRGDLEHELEVVFPEAARERIERLMGEDATPHQP